jgi:hypothetical protein
MKMQLYEADPAHVRRQIEELEEAQEEAMKVDYTSARKEWNLTQDQALVEKMISKEEGESTPEGETASKQEGTASEYKRTAHQLRREAVAVIAAATTRRTHNKRGDSMDAQVHF